MRLWTATWLLLVIWGDSGFVQQAGEYDSLQDCKNGFQSVIACQTKVLKKEDMSKSCFWKCGEMSGFCFQGEHLNAPGVIFPQPKQWNCGD